MAEKSLSEICKEITDRDISSTDKNRGPHDFMSLYSQIFAPYRDSAEKMFEIGVNRGGSIVMWERYFKKAIIHGLDIYFRKGKARMIEHDRLKLIELDQSKKDQLENFGKTYGPFDIGIDDGSHVWSHQILTFETLWPYIKPNGLFVIEDVITSYEWWIKQEGQKRLNRNYNEKHPNCVEYFQNMIHHLNFDGNDTLPPETWTIYQNTIDWIAFRTNTIFIKKKP